MLISFHQDGPGMMYLIAHEGTGMNKSELIEALAKAEGITLTAATSAVQVTFDGITQAMMKGDRIEIRGFGSFKVKGYDGYSGRNPMTGEKIEVSAKKLPFFKVGKELRVRLNDGGEGSE